MSKSATTEWNNLQNILKATKPHPNPNLMPALGAYWHGNIFILQEEADLSLHDYLKGEGQQFTGEELWKQVQGLADGLRELHNLYQGAKIAYHQDLKPANILILKGTMKIADFGLLELKPVLADDYDTTGVIGAHNTGNYTAPRRGLYSREDDMWSFACVMSELATSDLQGRDEIAKYRQGRIADSGSGTPKFFVGTSVKRHVLDRHTKLRSKALEASPDSFQRRFYSNSFFKLLNRMFRHSDASGNFPEDFVHVSVPTAAEVAKVIEQICQEATPTDQVTKEVLLAQISTPDAEELIITLESIAVRIKDDLDQEVGGRLYLASMSDFKQFLVDLQAKQCSNRHQQGLKRLTPFIDAMEQFEHLMARLSEVPCRDLMALIWVIALQIIDSRYTRLT